MNEDLLHFIWKFGYFDATNLTTTKGEKVEIIHRGQHNTHAGPDFTNCKIKIGKVLWAGNVELHLNSSDWFLHKHQTDEAYNSIILHVVLEQNGEAATRADGAEIPTLALGNRINAGTLSRYAELNKRRNWIPCERFFGDVSEMVRYTHLSRLLVERLEHKVEHIETLLKECANDWEQVMFVMLARYMGASINKEPFELLAKSLPVTIWARHLHEPLRIEALVFGQAGFLNEKYEDDYPNNLRKEYQYLKRLHQLTPLPKHLFKFLRLRPSNFPTVRLAQLAGLMCNEPKLFSELAAAKDVKGAVALLEGEVNVYWKTHYHFDKLTKGARVNMGAAIKQVLIINAVAPVLFAYGRYKADETYCDKAMSWLEQCKAESNAIVTRWQKLQVKPLNAFDTQALLQLKNEHCDKFMCLSCGIGLKILS